MEAGHLLKFTPTNFSNTIYDTDDLSTIRGSSIKILRAPAEVRKMLANNIPAGVEMRVLQEAASELLVQYYIKKKLHRVARKQLHKSIKKIFKRLKTEFNLSKKRFDSGQLNSETDVLNESMAALKSASPDTNWSNEEIENAAGYLLTVLGASAMIAADGASDLQEPVYNKLVSLISTHLAKKYRLFSFEIACQRIDPDKDLTFNLNRLDQQLAIQESKAISVAPAALEFGGQGVCRLTGTLAAEDTAIKQGLPISKSVAERRDCGREQKRKFYVEQLKRGKLAIEKVNQTELSEAAKSQLNAARTKIKEALAQLDTETTKYEFANHFHEIVDGVPDTLPPSVKRKIAVLFMDGNSFGKARDARIAQGPDALVLFSLYMEAITAGLLAELLLWMCKTNSMKAEIDGRNFYRFETLLWGGDEMAFVCPAHMGFDLCQVIQSAIAAWVEPEQDTTEKLTFKIGMAFASYKSPIKAIRDAAEDLSNMAKGAETIFQMQTYEGIDQLHFNPVHLRAQNYGQIFDIDPFQIAGTKLAALKNAINYLAKNDIGRRQLGVYVHKAIAGNEDIVEEMLQDWRNRLKNTEVAEVFKNLDFSPAGAANKLGPLFQLFELWDYGLEPTS